MAELSSMLPLGTLAPDFNLLEPRTQRYLSLQMQKSDRATVIMFICNHCPYVKYIQPAIIDLANHYQPLGVSLIAISSNDASLYPEDGPEQIAVVAETLPFPYLYDESQAIAKAYHAVCTPDFFVFDHDLKCVYRGRFDEANHKNGIQPSGRDLKLALDALLAGEPITVEQKPSMGCAIKWK